MLNLPKRTTGFFLFESFLLKCRLKQDYNATAASYKERLVRVEEVLNDRTIDNTMAGAKRRIDDFYKYNFCWFFLL